MSRGQTVTDMFEHGKVVDSKRVTARFQVLLTGEGGVVSQNFFRADARVVALPNYVPVTKLVTIRAWGSTHSEKHVGT